jgi:hypothetical protein
MLFLAKRDPFAFAIALPRPFPGGAPEALLDAFLLRRG